MAKTFKIAVNPTFSAIVEVPRVGGDNLQVPFVFKSKNRVELAALFTKWQKAQEDLIESGGDFTLEEWAEHEIKLQVEQIKDITHGWGFEDKFTDENIEALVATAIDVATAITDAYGAAYTKARKGN